MPTLTAARLAELEAKPVLTPWEQRYASFLRNEVRKQDRFRQRYRTDHMFRWEQRTKARARREGWRF